MSGGRPKFNHATVREEADRLLGLGFEFEGYSGNTHPLFVHPDYGRISLPLTPSKEWRYHFRRKLASMMGVSKAELEIRLGIRQEKRKGPKVRRQRNEAGRRARRFVVRDTPQTQPERVGTAEERLREIAEEIGAVAQGMNYATGEEYDSLLAEHTRLRGEYCQLEAETRAAA